MRKKIVYFTCLFLIINLCIIISGKKWVYKAIAITYLKGYSSSYISDYIYFPANIINAGNHQEWLVGKNYNLAKLPAFIDSLNSVLETTAFVVIQNDSVIFEKYWHEYSADSMSNSYSVAKSWVSTLIGVAIKEQKIKDVNETVCLFLPEFCTGENSRVTIKHLLTMSSGLNWKESYYNPLGKTSEAYYGNNIKKLMLSLKNVEPPGETFKYQSACTQILTFILEKATGKTISDYASEKLWRPMGAKHPALWSIDKENGDEKGFCCINSNARDFARLGRLYLNFGSWNGKQILDSTYIKEATSYSNLVDENKNKNTKYGYHFWIAKHKNMHVFYSRGLWGQYVICIPEKNAIIVRLGRKYGNQKKCGHFDDFYAYIDASLEILK